MDSFRFLAATLLAGGLLVVATTAGASPSGASTLTYGGIGATLADFSASNPDGPGKPPPGTTYYRIDRAQNGRVLGYHVVIGWPTRYRPYVVLRRLTGRELPSDVRVVKPYNGYCAIYRSRWLSRVAGPPGPFLYIVVYAPTRAAAKRAGVGWPWNGVEVSIDPNCRG